jgi:hypothetical protein
MFYAPGLVFGGTEGVGCNFYLFALPNSFSAVQLTLGPVFMFCALGLIFIGIKDFRSSFGLYRGRRVMFSCFTLPDSFPMELKAPV